MSASDWPLACDRASASFSELVRGRSAEDRRGEHHDALGEDRAPRRVEVGAHARGIDREAGDHAAHRLERGAGGLQRLGDHRPLGLPGADGPLVLLDEAGQHRRGEARQARRRGQRPRAARRVPLVRHRRRSAARLARLADFELHQQADVAGDLAEDAGVDRAGGDQRREPIARGVPRRGGRRQPELARQRVGDRRAAIAERRERAGRAAELDARGVVPRLLDARPAPAQARVPARRLQAERDRRRRLQQRAAEHHRAGVPIRQQRAAAPPAPRDRAPARGRRARSAATSPCRRCPGWWRPSGRSAPRRGRSPRRARSARRPAGSRSWPTRGPRARARRRRSRRRRRRCVIAAAAAAGITPSAAWARASAASTSSSACTDGRVAEDRAQRLGRGQRVDDPATSRRLTDRRRRSRRSPWSRTTKSHVDAVARAARQQRRPPFGRHERAASDRDRAPDRPRSRCACRGGAAGRA